MEKTHSKSHTAKQETQQQQQQQQSQQSQQQSQQSQQQQPQQFHRHHPAIFVAVRSLVGSQPRHVGGLSYVGNGTFALGYYKGGKCRNDAFSLEDYQQLQKRTHKT